jgi:DNA-binding LacI/PurR family transcriptional regulator
MTDALKQPVKRLGMVTLRDIAEEFDVSISTVSRALGEETSDKVAADLRTRILEFARAVNYTPHPAAQLMRKPRVHLVTALLPLATDSFISDYVNGILAGMVTAARDLEMEARVSLLNQDDDDILRQVRHAAIGAGSIVLIGKYLTLRQAMKLEELERPTIVLNACLPPNLAVEDFGLSTVGTNNQESYRELTSEILKAGHRRLALINGPIHQRDAWERQQGFINALTENRVPIDHSAILNGSFTAEGGANGWDKLKQHPVRPTAIMCGSDEIAFGVLDKLAQEKIACPAEISVVGYDDSRLAARITPALTTVRQPTIEIGRAAVEMLSGWAKNSSFEVAVEHRVLPGTIVRRNSVAPPPPDSQ